ncbi:MAG: 30S ribosomal protein S20 [Vampirovibrionales bacterium]|nr:30S ribosomal protein S20 [Vampirovibrionales bacterium]
MPRIQSAKKRVDVSERNRQRNVAYKSAIKTAIKKVLNVKEVPDAQKALNEAFSLIDRAVLKGILKKNTAARYKSRIAKQSLKSA